VIDVWESREAFDLEVLTPLGFTGLPRAEFAVHNLLATWRAGSRGLGHAP
jgi:hypothetical protein